jgi:hypothetical protein
MFRFSIRDVLWLTVVVGLAIVWRGEVQQHKADAQLLQRIKSAAQFGGTDEGITDLWRIANSIH